MPKAKYPVKLEMTEEELKIFMEIKEHYGIGSDAEVLRVALKTEHTIIKDRRKILLSVAKQKIKSD